MIDYSKIKQELLERKKTLEEQLNHDFDLEHEKPLAESMELSLYDNHPADLGTELFEREKDFAIEAHLGREREEIDHALQKFKDGTFGICEASGELIPYERLEANPIARTVINKASPKHVPDDRPVEEDVLGGFDKYNYDGRDDETEFDAEDAYQSVARFNDNPMTYEGSSLDETDELIGSVEQIEAFLSTGIEGYTGPDNVDFLRNVHYDKYINENEQDEEDL
ncbi:hypothetical protein GN156_01405 [bacterium LRH843]|nr:hypothetical protein [bacterium LRH843]